MLKNAWGLLKQTGKEWSEDKVPRLGAALAYYTVFAIAPLLIIAIGIAGLAFGAEAVRGQVASQLETLISPEAAEAINEMIKNASKPSSGILATIIGFVTLLFGASGVFGQLKDAMNTIWGVAPRPGRGIMGIIKDRFLSFTMVLGIGFLLLVSLMVSAALSAFQKFVFGDSAGIVLQIVNFVVSFGVITLLFAVIYKVLPDVKIAWRDVWIGAAVTALLFTVGKYLIGVYLGRSSTTSTFGAFGSLVVILLWVYYSAQILFFGAEFTQVYANQYGSHVVPDKDAVPVTEEARAKQGMPSKERLQEAAGNPGGPLGAGGDEPYGRRAARPVWGSKLKGKKAEVVTTQRVKAMEKQRYVAAVGGFIFALVVGALKNLRGGPPKINT
ncbi:MAG TPA: YihY/virulence factor BrkB family protein [Herpetosiphonaceae bacterium]|nr:YihY/virulence factor BrkB family protein [Herpetosiphonaceae bacterium]